jgi:hypothetical protein
MIARIEKSSKLQRLSCSRETVRKAIEGKTVAIVGSGPGVLKNKSGFIDSHNVVLRVNNYKLSLEAGNRTDIYYSFFGASIRKQRKDLIRDGVKLCICKCPNAKFMESRWHNQNGKHRGTDFRYIYDGRREWWFCKTYVPTVEEFMESFDLLGGHVPTTGFAAIYEVLKYNPKSVYITGFDFFKSGVHNVNEPWKAGDPNDPICHVPDVELEWLRSNMNNYPIKLDQTLQEIIENKCTKEETRRRLYPPNIVGNKGVIAA